MFSFFTRFLFFSALFFLFSVKVSANDSDQINCNRSWKIAILGSSTSFGQGASTYDSSWAGKFTAYVKRKNPLNEINNLGIPGFTSYKNLCPTGFVPPAGRPTPDAGFNITAALSWHPDAIIINLPSNDAASDFTVAEQQANFERALHLADSAKVSVWVTTTQPRNNVTSAQLSNLTTMRDWILNRFGTKAVDYWTTLANPDGSIVAQYMFDNVHVNNLGHAIFFKRMLAETILDSLCIRYTQTLVARAGNDTSLILPVSSTVLNGSGSFSSNGGIITSYQWTKISGPVSSQIMSASNSVTTVNNLSEGRYSFRLMVTDNLSNIKSDTVNVTVSSRILIDIGPDATASPDAGSKYWNNISDAQNGIKLQNAITTGNLPTTIGLTVVNRIDGTFNTGGPGTNTGNSAGAINDYPATATSDFAFADPSATNGSWKITGLQASKQYVIKFWGTRTVPDERIIRIKRADQPASTFQEYNAANNSNYNTAAIFTFSGKSEMSFDIIVKSGSAFGHIGIIDISRTSPPVAGNLPPVPRAGNDAVVALPASSTVLDGSNSTDEDGVITSYQWTRISGPGNPQIVSPNSAVTAVNNLMEGVYAFELTVTDDSSAVRSDTVNVTVSSRVLFDFGPDATATPDAGGKYWNEVPNGLPGIKISNAVTTGNTASAISFEIINRIDGTFNPSGPGTNTGNTIGAVGDYPVTATSDFAFAHPSATNGNWKISGLNASKQYTIKFWGTRSAADERIIEIKRADESTWKEYDAAGNSDYNRAAVFTFTGKTEMAFDIRVKSTSAFGHINVIDISITNPVVSCTAGLTISATPSGASCSGSMVSFTSVAVNGGTLPTYQWKKNGINIAGATSATYSTTTLMNNDIITCFLTSNLFCATGNTALSNSITRTVLPIAPKLGAISGPSEVCSFVGTSNIASYSVAAVQNAVTYTWTVPNGATIVSGQGTTAIGVTYSNPGGVDTIKVIAGPCTNSPATTLVITKVLPAIPVSISGPTNVCPFIDQPVNAVYTIAPVANASSYTWTPPAGATVVSGQGTTSVQVSYNSAFSTGSIQVTANANCGSRTPRTLTVSKLVPAVPAAISGITNACGLIGTGTQVNYSISSVVNATSYLWTLPANVTLVSGQGTTSIMVTFNAGFVASVIKVRSVSNCASSADKSLSIAAAGGSTPGVITGSVNACGFIGSGFIPDAVYTIRKVANATSYLWAVPAGATITSHPGGNGLNDTIINVSYDNNFVSGTAISVKAVACVPGTARTLTIVRSGAPGTPAAITGATNPCSFVGTGTIVPYTIRKISFATSYNWIIPVGATATHPAGAGVNDTIVHVTFNAGFVNGTISVTSANGCGSNNIARSLSVNAIAPTATPVITGPVDPCPWIGTSGAVYKINKIANVTGYTWTVPSTGATVTHPNGAGINDTIINVVFTSAFTSGNITVKADANCGSSPVRTFVLTRYLPSVPGNILTSLITACPNRQYSYSVAALPANATSITWTVPAGATINSGQGTTSIVVSYPSSAISGTVTAAGTNNCGNSTSVRSLGVSLPVCSALRGATENIVLQKSQLEILNETAAKELEITVMPNPSYDQFRLVIVSNDLTLPISLRISDLSGKVMETRQNLKFNQGIYIGADYVKGIYIGEIIQGNNRKIIKLVKL